MQNLTCTQCGTCCRKGGPLLHKTDIPLLTEGHISFSHILTLRAGELAFDPVYNKLIPLEEEALKIHGSGETKHPWHCIFHKDKNCGLHPQRPAQCAALHCTDTSALQAMYHEDRACRADIFHAQAGWQELVEAHEEQCPLHPLVSHGRILHESQDSHDQAQATQEILQCVRYDMAFRELCVEKAQLPQEILPCLLGRPVHHFIQSLGLAAQHDAQGQLVLKKLANAAYFS